MTPRSAALAALLVTAGIALAGCGSDQTAGSAPQTPTLPTGALNGRPDASASGGNLITNPPNGGNVKAGQIPAGFPLPLLQPASESAAASTPAAAVREVIDGPFDAAVGADPTAAPAPPAG